MKIDMSYASFNKHFARTREDDNLRPRVLLAGLVSLLEGVIYSFIKDRTRDISSYTHVPMILLGD